MLSKIFSSKLFHIALGFVVSGTLIAWMVINIEWQAVGALLSSIRWWILVPMTGAVAIQFWFRSIRWRHLIYNGLQLPLKPLWDGQVLGNFANYILPLRAGEIVRPLYLSMQSSVPFSAGFISVVIERFFDLSTVLFCFLVIIKVGPPLPEWAYAGAISLSLLGGAILAFMFFACFWPTLLQRVIDATLNLLPARVCSLVASFLQNLSRGVQVVRDPRQFFKITTLSALVWTMTMIQLWLGLYLFPIDALTSTSSIALALTTMVVIALAVAAPSAPGFVGVYQVACIAAFAMFGLSKEIAMAFAIITHLHMIVIFLVYGPILLVQQGLELGSIIKKR